MLQRVLLWVLVFLISACSSSSKKEKLRTAIQQKLGEVQGTFAVAFYDLHSGDTLLINATESFHAASTMKTPVMMEVYRQVAAGKWKLEDSVTIKNEFSSIVDGSAYSLTPDDDSEQELYTLIGKQKTLYELVYDMIIVSSNLATNIVIELADAQQVTQTMRDLGAPYIHVLRGVEDTKAYRQGLNNTTTALDQLMIYKGLAEGSFVSKEASDAMIRILLDQQFNEIIPAQLPSDVNVAHKTGWITGVHHDCGIVLLPDGRKYVLALLSKELNDENAGVAAMADVSKMIYDYVSR